MMFIMSSEDTVIRMCYENDPEFWQQWRNELATIARRIITKKPNMGLFLPNCPFHVGLFNNLFASVNIWKCMLEWSYQPEIVFLA